MWAFQAVDAVFLPVVQQPEPDTDRWLSYSERDMKVVGTVVFLCQCVEEKMEREGDELGQFWSWTEGKE